MFISPLFLLTLSIGTLCHPETDQPLQGRGSGPWIATFDISDVKCSNRTRYQDDFSLSNGACVTFARGGNPDYDDFGHAGSVGGGWGDLTNITAYESGDCSSPPVWVITRIGSDDGFCELLSVLGSAFYAAVKGVGDQPMVAQHQFDTVID